MEIAQLRQLLLDEWVITPQTFREADDQKVIEIANRQGYGDRIANREDTGGRVTDPEREKRERDIETASRAMTGDDGDGLPSGRYEVGADGNLHRIGDTELLDRYHGSPQLDVISDFRASPAGHTEGGRRGLNALPAVYTTEGIGVAEQYAYGASVNAVASRAKDPHLYSLALTPSEIVELGECEDDATVRLAASLGADVLECPDFGEQPETVVLDDRIVHVREATNLDTGATLPVRPKSRAKKMVPIESPGERCQGKAIGPPTSVIITMKDQTAPAPLVRVADTMEVTPGETWVEVFPRASVKTSKATGTEGIHDLDEGLVTEHSMGDPMALQVISSDNNPPSKNRKLVDVMEVQPTASGVSVRPRSSPKISREKKRGGNPPKRSGKKATAGRLASATGGKGK